MPKQLAFEHEAREHLRAGVAKLAKAVRSTYGPRGRTAVIDKGWGNPTVTKDGVSVAEEVELSDPYENLGAQLLKEAATKTSPISPATAPPPRRFWPRPCTARACAS